MAKPKSTDAPREQIRIALGSMGVIFLETNKIYLTPVTHQHCNENYLLWFDDPDTGKYIESAAEKMTIGKLKDFVTLKEKEGAIFLAIHDKSTGKHVGNIKIDLIDRGAMTGEYGILIGDRNSRGKGFSRDASVLLIDHCFNDLGFRSITLGLLAENEKALSLYKSLGFETESIISDEQSGKKKVIRMRLVKDKWKS